MTELEDALIDLNTTVELAREIAAYYWEPLEGSDDVENGKLTARVLHADYPLSTADQLLAVSRASGVVPTEAELEGWEQFWAELGLDNQPEVEHTASTGWHQPPLPGLESI